jgi:chromosomal replication initiator protein
MDENLNTLWKHIADVIRTEVSTDSYQRWFMPVELVQTDESHLTLRVPNNIFQLWIESNYMPLVQAAILKVLGAPLKIKFIFAGETQVIPARSEARREIRNGDVEHNGDNGQSSGGQSENGAAVHGGMNPRNTFDSFVVGQNNQFAHAAALAVGQAPAKTYNPLFVYGGVGLGKTHLMQAIGQLVISRKKTAKVMYLSSEKFTNEFIDAIQNSTLVKFRKKYRQADVLLIDDIQFLAGKERSQEEFFHTFNTLFDGHKQIVLSSDRPPTEIKNLEQRLVSRFEWGLTAELQPPDIETRMAILRKKVQTLDIKLDNRVIEFIATRIRTNVRRLEGALMRVASYASLSGRDLNDEAVEHLLKDILQEEAKRTVTIDQIQRKVAEHFDVRLADMTSKRRPANIAFPRQVAMFLAREHTKASLSEIGDAFGGRDHGTVLHAHKLVTEKIKTTEKVRQVISFLDSQLTR